MKMATSKRSKSPLGFEMSPTPLTTVLGIKESDRTEVLFEGMGETDMGDRWGRSPVAHVKLQGHVQPVPRDWIPPGAQPGQKVTLKRTPTEIVWWDQGGGMKGPDYPRPKRAVPGATTSPGSEAYRLHQRSGTDYPSGQSSPKVRDKRSRRSKVMRKG